MVNTKRGKDLNTHVVYNPETREYELISLESGEVVSSGGLRGSIERYVFHADIAVWICQEVRMGKTLTEIGEDKRFPPYEVISHWRRMHPLFDDQLKLARRDRAEGYHDKIIDMADRLNETGGIMSKEEIAAKKISMDAYKWAAEKNDPDSFGKKQEIRHENTAPTTIVVNTGIVRNKPDVIVNDTGE